MIINYSNFLQAWFQYQFHSYARVLHVEELWFTSVVSPSSSSPAILITSAYPIMFRWRTAGSVFWLLLLATSVLFTIILTALWGEGAAGSWSPWWLGWIVVYLTCLALLQTSHAAICTGVNKLVPLLHTYCSAYFSSSSSCLSSPLPLPLGQQ